MTKPREFKLYYQTLLEAEQQSLETVSVNNKDSNSDIFVRVYLILLILVVILFPIIGIATGILK